MRRILVIILLICSHKCFGQLEALTPVNTRYFDYYSFYHTTRDSIKIAVDVFLPVRLKTGEKVPTVFYLTRYVRSLELVGALKWLREPFLGQVSKEEIDFFTRNRYACVIVDARGSGASFGHRMMDFTTDELRDGAEIFDWIIAQSWSNGKIGTTGISYLGTTCELLLANRHPAVKACIPRSNIFDLYGDISFPGGIRQGPFVHAWGKTTRALDNNDFSIFGWFAGLLKGINPVMNDDQRIMLAQALEDHKRNYDVFNEILRIEYRDELHPHLQRPIDDFSIHSRCSEIAGSGTAIFRIGGWYDGALSNSVFKGFWNNPNTSHVLIGPWDHGPRDNASPYSHTHQVKYNVYEDMLRFFDYHLKGINNGLEQEPGIKFFTVGWENWRFSKTWPPENVRYQNWYLSRENRFSPIATEAMDSVILPLNYATGTGGGSRWNSQTTIYKLEKHTGYPDRKSQTESLFYFESQPLSSPLIITGHPEVRLVCSFPEEDACVFVYVDEISPEGKVRYVTEGMFRAIHRKVTESNGYKVPGPYHSFRRQDAMKLVPGERTTLEFALLPISYAVPEGHRIRISISGADPDHFDMPESRPAQMVIYNSSCILLPVEVH